MAAHLRTIRIVSQHGKRSMVFRMSSFTTKQICLPLSTSASSSQEITRKMLPNEGFWDKNERMKRPMSPHLTIYKFELPALLSGSHRATGFALSGVIALVGVGSLVLPGNPSSYIEVIRAFDLPTWFLASGKLLLIWPVVYHTFNGVRHLAWDTGRGYDMKTLYKTGYFVVGTSIVTALGILASLYQ
ncbi:succinate dehydrogenase cytochrome b560 subunit, mitochondrial-like [Hydractinia symbiolongicarpus]|uniref:succinate dehydrogenase cytochrome b560 subunit, mitochondrial-like n=1 Tax=Hydractinia symbiolongicarpus TaxID=13093 RepID=UPI00254DF811|nr:succinate dehydrogenase cytochrome b560 subunit, mitochondrial-like [Hydractinia symbiolongicarpus]